MLDVDDVKSVVSTLRQTRLRYGVSIRTAASQLGISTGHYARIENVQTVPSFDLAMKLCRFYRTQFELLFHEHILKTDPTYFL
ncbi:MAG: helix-turn-helix transcriptional regulator [Terriglobia bacterium]